MHPAIIIGTVRSLIVDVAMGQILPRSTERISNYCYNGNCLFSLRRSYVILSLFFLFLFATVLRRIKIVNN